MQLEIFLLTLARRKFFSLIIHLSKKFLRLKVVRYFFTAITATAVDVSVFKLTIHYILKNNNWHLTESITVGAPTIALMISFCFGLATNFTLTRKFVFTESDLRVRHQFMRYTAVALFALLFNYFLMTFLIKQFDWDPTLARATAAVSIGVVSFMVHKTFSFTIRDEEEVD